MAPTGISTPQDLINYFNNLQGNGIVSGEFVATGYPARTTTDPLAALQSATGQYVGMIGIDYWPAGGTGPASTAAANAAAIAQWNAGGLIEVNAAMPNPTTGGGSQDTSNLDVAGLLTPGTTTNNALNARLSQVAAGLRELQDAGVVVIYRPYWEMNGNWNWWGANMLSASQFQDLWRYTYNYMTNTMGLHNLVWEYAINAGTTLSGRTLTDTYPGNAYVDITGQDLYSDNPGSAGQSTYQALLALGKPTALAEFGPGSAASGDPGFSMPSLISQIQADMPKTVYWLQWWSQNSGGNGWGMEQDQNTAAALNDGYVINRGQITNTSTSAPASHPTSTASANDTVVPAGSAAAITDASGNAWTITANGQVAVNGTIDTSTANVTELAYVNGMVWQQNASHLWWGKTTPAASWSPGNGTATSPLPATAIPSANDTTVLAGSSAPIIDASGNTWTITVNGQIAVNGTIDTSTANVTELAYVNGMVWQQNASHLWWGKTTPAASWSPGNGTATSPLPAPINITPGSTNATVSQNDVSVIATTGRNMMFITGSNDIVDVSGGTNTVTDTGHGNTYIVPAPGKGTVRFTSDIMSNGDTLDLKPALAATHWNGAASTLPEYLTVTDSSRGASVSLATTAGGTGTTIAVMSGATSLDLKTLLAHAIV